MLARAFFAAILIVGFTGASPAQNDVTASFYGRVLVDGRPLERTIEIRLEREDGALSATAYTHSSSEFSFNFIQIRPGSRHYLVIRDLSYKELRYQFDLDDLFRDPLTGIYSGKKAFLLQLESIPSSASKIIGSKTVDYRQILPEGAQNEYNAAIEELQRGDNKSAMKRLENVLQLAPQHIDSLNRLGAEHLKIGNYDRAEQLLLKAHGLKSNDATNLANLGVLYFQKGEKLASSNDAAQQKEAVQLHQKAVVYLQQALQLDPKSQRAMYYLGTALYGLGDYRKAESLLIKALARDDPMPEAHLTLINLYVKQKRYDAAIEQIEAFLKINPDASIKEQLEKTIQQIKKEKSTK